MKSIDAELQSLSNVDIMRLFTMEMTRRGFTGIAYFFRSIGPSDPDPVDLITFSIYPTEIAMKMQKLTTAEALNQFALHAAFNPPENRQLAENGEINTDDVFELDEDVPMDEMDS